MVDEKTREKNYNLVSYWALAYNCIVLDKIMLYISMTGLILLGFFVKIGESACAVLIALRFLSINAFAITLIISLILLRYNNKMLRAVINNQNTKNDRVFELLDDISFSNCLIGIFTLVFFILIQ